MEKDAYLELLNNNPYKKEAIKLFDFFEKYIDNSFNDSLVFLMEIQDAIAKSEMKNDVAIFKKRLKAENRNIINEYIILFKRYLSDFCKHNVTREDLAKSQERWKKVLLSYVSLSRIVIEDPKIQSFLESPSSEKKTILAVAMLKISEDTIRANEEITYIQELSRYSSDYLVLPIHGCVWDTFLTRLKNNKIDIIHLVGHGNNNKIKFADSSVKYSTIQKYLTDMYDLFFLNCCDTFNYVERNAVPFSTTTICHDGSLPANQAFNASEVFYQTLFCGVTINQAWNTTKISANTDGYYMLP